MISNGSEPAAQARELAAVHPLLARGLNQRRNCEETLNLSVNPAFDKRRDPSPATALSGVYSLISRCFRYARRCASRPCAFVICSHRSAAFCRAASAAALSADGVLAASSRAAIYSSTPGMRGTKRHCSAFNAASRVLRSLCARSPDDCAGSYHAATIAASDRRTGSNRRCRRDRVACSSSADASQASKLERTRAVARRRCHSHQAIRKSQARGRSRSTRFASDSLRCLWLRESLSMPRRTPGP